MIKDKHKKYYQSLTRNMTLTVILVSFAPMILVISILLQQFDKAYHEKTNAHLSVLVQKHRQNIDSFLNEKLSDIRFLATNNSFERLNDNKFLRNQLASLQKNYGNVFVDLGLVNEEGLQVAYAGPYELKDAAYSNAAWFKAASVTDSYISDVFMGLRALQHFIVTTKIEGPDGIYLLRGTIDFQSFNDLVQNLRVGQTGFAFILNKAGEFQTSPTMEYRPNQSDYKDFWNSVEKTKNNISITRWEDDTDTENLYAIGSLKSGEWLLIVQQETSDAFSDLSRMFNIAVAIFIIGGIAIVVVAFVMSRKMVRRVHRSDQAKESMNEQIVESGKMASIGELAAGIAHEINNPVAIMVEEAGWIGDLLEEEEFSQSENLEEFTRALAQINTQGKRCKEITHKLLSFARKTDSTVKDVQINDIVKEIVSLSAQMAKYNKVSVDTELNVNLPYITISPSEMQQVLLNLINNAIDAMEKTGGNVLVSTKISQLEEDHIVVIVEDDGPGIPEANFSRIFDPFFTSKPVGKGTGLGLSICYGIITKMGGKIDVQSKVGFGSRFRIWIPIQKEK